MDIKRFKYATNIIPIAECVSHGTYYLSGVHLTVGVWDPDQSGFVGLVRPGTHELIIERHIHMNMFARGSAAPRGQLDVCPVGDLAKVILTCHHCTGRVYYERTAPPAGGTGGHSRYIHLSDHSPVCDHVVALPNLELIAYLERWNDEVAQGVRT